MALILVLIILVLGYRYCTAIPVQQAILKRSAGWESYVLLGHHGITIIFQGLLAFLIFVIFGYVLTVTVALPKLAFTLENYDPINWFTELIWFKQIAQIDVWMAGVILFSMVMCQHKINQDKKKQAEMHNWTSQLRNLDAILDIVIYASSEIKPVKISLKSRKVYVGVIVSEQFEHIDSDNIVIIPYLSGHREKDTLVVNFDHNYLEVYKKNSNNNLEPQTDTTFPVDMKEFKCVIRLNEVESISLFDFKYYQDFHHEEK